MRSLSENTHPYESVWTGLSGSADRKRNQDEVDGRGGVAPAPAVNLILVP